MATRKPRSPKYPQLPLREAIERVGKAHKANRTYRVEKVSVARALGYGGVNGASVSLIGTLKQYGLLEENKEGVMVTQAAVTILRAPEGDLERAQALRAAAFAPKIFTDLREAYGEDVSELPAETTLQYRLEQRGFLEKAAGEVIRTYRDNLEFVSEEAAEYTEPETVDDQPMEAPQMQTQQPPTTTQAGSVATVGGPVSAIEQEPFTETLQYRISGDSKVRLLFDGVVTQEAIEKLIAYLKLGKDDFPSKADLEQPAVEEFSEQTIIEMPEAE